MTPPSTIPTPRTEGAINVAWTLDGDSRSLFLARKMGVMEQQLTIALAALEKISKTGACHGPGCDYCQEGVNHPPSYEATLALKSLSEIQSLTP